MDKERCLGSRWKRGYQLESGCEREISKVFANVSVFTIKIKAVTPSNYRGIKEIF